MWIIIGIVVIIALVIQAINWEDFNVRYWTANPVDKKQCLCLLITYQTYTTLIAAVIVGCLYICCNIK